MFVFVCVRVQKHCALTTAADKIVPRTAKTRIAVRFVKKLPRCSEYLWSAVKCVYT